MHKVKSMTIAVCLLAATMAWAGSLQLTPPDNQLLPATMRQPEILRGHSPGGIFLPTTVRLTAPGDKAPALTQEEFDARFDTALTKKSHLDSPILLASHS